MDKIIIKDLKIYAYHGVNEEEKIEGQYFLIDIVCSLDLDKPCLDDNVASTVSYAQIMKTARAAFTAEKYDLIERAARVTADAVLDAFHDIKEITLTLKKPEAPAKADFGYAAVEITRSR